MVSLVPLLPRSSDYKFAPVCCCFPLFGSYGCLPHLLPNLPWPLPHLRYRPCCHHDQVPWYLHLNITFTGFLITYVELNGNLNSNPLLLSGRHTLDAGFLDANVEAMRLLFGWIQLEHGLGHVGHHHVRSDKCHPSQNYWWCWHACCHHCPQLLLWLSPQCWGLHV